MVNTLAHKNILFNLYCWIYYFYIIIIIIIIIIVIKLSIIINIIVYILFLPDVSLIRSRASRAGFLAPYRALHGRPFDKKEKEF